MDLGALLEDGENPAGCGEEESLPEEFTFHVVFGAEMVVTHGGVEVARAPAPPRFIRPEFSLRSVLQEYYGSEIPLRVVQLGFPDAPEPAPHPAVLRLC